MNTSDPDMQIRLSDKTSRLHPRHVVPKRRTFDCTSLRAAATCRRGNAARCDRRWPIATRRACVVEAGRHRPELRDLLQGSVSTLSDEPEIAPRLFPGRAGGALG